MVKLIVWAWIFIFVLACCSHTKRNTDKEKVFKALFMEIIQLLKFPIFDYFL